MAHSSLIADDPFPFPPDQRPALPGAPARPPHPPTRRIAYGMVGLLTSLTSGLGAGLVRFNGNYLLGPLSATPTEIAWLPTVYLMTYVTMNLLLVRARQQFGLRAFALAGLSLFCLVTVAHEWATGLGGAILIHALAGIATAPLLALSTYYMMASMPRAYSLNGAALAIGLSQLPTPLSRLFPTDTIDIDQWSHLYDIELGLGLLTFVAIALVRLPPSERTRVFERIDFVTWGLFASGMALLTAVVGMGRVEWWTDRLWLGWALAGSVPLITAALLIEYHRERPLLDLRFLTRAHLFRFAFIMMVMRTVLAEQGTLAFGLLGSDGLLTIDLRLFSAALVFASLLGAATAALLFRPGRITAIGGIAFLLIAVSAIIDSGSTSLTRAPQLYATQMMISFATSFGVGPSLLYGLTRVMKAGGQMLVSFMVLFSIVQNVGNLLGAALLGTYQVFKTGRASVALIARAPDYDPAVQARLHELGGGPDAVSVLQHAMQGQAEVIAYNNSFAGVALLAAAAALYMLIRFLIDWRTLQRGQAR